MRAVPVHAAAAAIVVNGHNGAHAYNGHPMADAAGLLANANANAHPPAPLRHNGKPRPTCPVNALCPSDFLSPFFSCILLFASRCDSHFLFFPEMFFSVSRVCMRFTPELIPT